MAGGEGSRLRPLTSNHPKPMVPIGTMPIMEHIVRHLSRQGFKEFVATTYYMGDEIKSYFGDGEDFGISLKFSNETVPLGTAGSVKKAEPMLSGKEVIIISGDALTDCDLTKALEFHREKKAMATLILYRVENPLEFGVVLTDPATHRVTGFLEKPTWAEVLSDTVNTGMYILDPKVLELMNNDESYDWSMDIFPKMLELDMPMYGFVTGGYWCDIGSLGQYRDAQEELLNRMVKLPIPGETHESGTYIGQNCSIDESAVLVPPVVLGNNVKIKKGARVGPYTTIGDNCLVEEYALVERSVLWESVYIGSGASLRSSIVCSRATIKKDCMLMEDSVIGDRCLLDMGATIRPKVKIWPDKIVERGSTVTMSLVWGHKWRGNLFRDLGVAGISNIEMTPDFAGRLASAFGSCFPNGAQIVTSRDSARSSRMLKRSLISSLLSVGCNVLDLRSAPVPIAKHYIRHSPAVAAISVRKLPGNSRVSLIEMFDRDGSYVSKNLERKVEGLFFREDYKRTDADDIGVIDFANRAIEEYEGSFLRYVKTDDAKHVPRVVCNYGYGAMSNNYPAILGRLGIETISLNAFNDSRRAPRTEDEIREHLSELSKIVGTLKYQVGVLFLDEGERLILVDDQGTVLEGYELFGAMASVLLQKTPGAKIVYPSHMPTKLCTWLSSKGGELLESKSNIRDLTQKVLNEKADFGGDDKGGFIFPQMHPGLDACFTFGWFAMWLAETGLKLADLRQTMPSFPTSYEATQVNWEEKGRVMRYLLDGAANHDPDLFDGVKYKSDGGIIHIIPDSFEPLFHIYTEADTKAESLHLAQTCVKNIQQIMGK
jgi:mannose-1-phosphate guanylyltransferase / phosphomannomutase